MNTNFRSERGQAIVLLAVVIVVLLGFTAVAIDGGMIYADRRNAQNAADAAALAGALEIVNSKNITRAIDTAGVSLEANGYEIANSHREVTYHTEWNGYYYLVTVTLTDTTPTYFAQIIYGGELTNVVTAVAKAKPSQPAAPGMAIMAMSETCAHNAKGSLIGLAGGGSDGVIRTYDGNMLVNTPGTATCALRPPSSSGAEGIVAEPGEDEDGNPVIYNIYSVGSYNYSGVPKISPVPIKTNINGGAPITDPLAHLPTPQCSGPGGKDADGNYLPGNYNYLPTGTPTSGYLKPGIYCIDGGKNMGGSVYSGEDGNVLLYLKDGSIKISGGDTLKISGPRADNCSGTVGDPTATCTFAGLAIFIDRDNHESLDINGNGELKTEGSIYHIGGTVSAGGGGNSPDDYVVKGQIIANRVHSNGHADFTVTYDAGNVVWVASQLSLVR